MKQNAGGRGSGAANSTPVAPTHQPERLWPHLRYVTLSDVRKELPGALGAWAIVSAISVGIGLGINWLTPFVTPTAITWKSPLPDWANYAVICAIAFWFLRGKAIHY